MAFGVAGLKLTGVVIDDSHVVSKSWPQFWGMIESL
jgi:5-enolpyruvylshikimate-3-phosphate synthase